MKLESGQVEDLPHAFMDQPSRQLVEHFFRHESANLIAVLGRAFGVGRLELVEDMVQSAMLEAMNSWKIKGVPDNPAGWIHKVARNRILDVLRRETVHAQAMAFAGQSEGASESLVDHWLEEEQLPDSLLRMMFVCCHPSLDRQSQIALTLKILCGFGVDEIARGLLINKAAAKKRIQRARRKLAELEVVPELPQVNELQDRLEVVHEVLYLMFNEGYSTSRGPDPIRDDLCEEAARLCHMLCENQLATTTTFALLALMLFHASRLDSRVDNDGAAVSLEEQDRSMWDTNLMRVAEHWLSKSGEGPVTRYHLEACIALQHCRATSVASTDWNVIVRCYDRLISMGSSPIYILNRAIAKTQAGDVQDAMDDLSSIQNDPEMSEYFLLDCAMAKTHELTGETGQAIDCYLAALSRGVAEHERAFIEKRIRALR